MLDVMFYEVFKEEEVALRSVLEDGGVPLSVDFTWKTIQETNPSKVFAKIICIRTQSQIPLSWAQNIGGILTRSKGDDHLQAYCQKAGKKIPFGSLPSYCSRAVAEQAITLMLSLLRKLKNQIKQFESFNRDDLTGAGCYGRNVLVVGVGDIGKVIVELSKGLGMNVKGVDLDEGQKALEYVSLAEGLPWADVIFCALPLTKETNNILGYEVLKNIKSKPVFINISRGEISPLNDLKALLDNEILGGIACDVFLKEPELAVNLRKGKASFVQELARRDNVIFTPHNAFNSTEALQKKAFLTVESIQSFLKTGYFSNAIEFESI